MFAYVNVTALSELDTGLECLQTFPTVMAILINIALPFYHFVIGLKLDHFLIISIKINTKEMLRNVI